MTRLLFRLRLRRLPTLRTEAEVLAALQQPKAFYARLER